LSRMFLMLVIKYEAISQSNRHAVSSCEIAGEIHRLPSLIEYPGVGETGPGRGSALKRETNAYPLSRTWYSSLSPSAFSFKIVAIHFENTKCRLPK